MVAKAAVASLLLAAASAGPLDRLEHRVRQLPPPPPPKGTPPPPPKGGPGYGIVDSKKLEGMMTEAGLRKRAEALWKVAQYSTNSTGHPTRVIGSAGHQGTLDYVWSELEKLNYYDLEKDPFNAVSGQINSFNLTVGGVAPETTLPMSLSPPTEGTVSGPLALVANVGCEAADYPDLANKIALVKRGTCPFGQKSELAGAAGAMAAIIYNNEAGNLSGTLGTPSENMVATFGVSDTEGAGFVTRLTAGEVIEVAAAMDSKVDNIETYNIIASTKLGDADNVVLLGGHSDSVPEGPGINDDGTGTGTLLEIAAALSKFPSLTNQVRFMWFSAEEEGLLGSDHYASTLTPEENMKIRLMMDYDMLASPNYAYQIYNSTDEAHPAGSQAIRDLYINWYKSKGIPYTFIAFDGRSDYDGFLTAGIPASGIATGAEGVKTADEAATFGGEAGKWYDPCYHQLCDDLNNPDYEAWVINSQLVAHSVATFASSLEDFPARAPLNATVTRRTLESKEMRNMFHGHVRIG